MVRNLDEHMKERLSDFRNSLKAYNKSTIEEECLVSIAESLLIICEKISKKIY